MQIVLDGYLTAKQYEWEEKPKFNWTLYDPTKYDKNSVLIRRESITLEVDDNLDLESLRIFRNKTALL